MRERDIEAALVDHVRRLGGLALKLVSPGRRGVPDRLVLLPGGRVIFIEVKKPGGALTLAQERMIAELREMGFEAKVLDDYDKIRSSIVEAG